MCYFTIMYSNAKYRRQNKHLVLHKRHQHHQHHQHHLMAILCGHWLFFSRLAEVQDIYLTLGNSFLEQFCYYPTQGSLGSTCLVVILLALLAASFKYLIQLN